MPTIYIRNIVYGFIEYVDVICSPIFSNGGVGAGFKAVGVYVVGFHGTRGLPLLEYKPVN